MPERSLNGEFGKLVREWRTQLGLSQEAFAYRCGVHRTYMTHIEQGTKMPSLGIVAQIARGLEVELSALFQALEERGVTVASITDPPRPR
jgi:transcriptional regulator with XRE-family HTH domain